MFNLRSGASYLGQPELLDPRVQHVFQSAVHLFGVLHLNGDTETLESTMSRNMNRYQTAAKRPGSKYLSLQGHQLHVQLTEEGVCGRGAAGHGHHVLLGQVHAFGGSAARALVVSVLQGLVLPPTQSHLRARHHRLHLVLQGRRRKGGRAVY